MLSLRFTDRHVRRHPTLIAIAIEYARSYDGEFEPMVEAQQNVSLRGTLALPEARKVLNCLRADTDPTVHSLQIEAESVLREERELTGAEDNELDRPKTELVVVQQERPWRLELAAAVKVECGSPKQRNGSIHRVLFAECWWEIPNPWSARKLPPHKRTERFPTLRVTWHCGKTAEWPLLFQLGDAPEGRGFCQTGCWED